MVGSINASTPLIPRVTAFIILSIGKSLTICITPLANSSPCVPHSNFWMKVNSEVRAPSIMPIRPSAISFHFSEANREFAPDARLLPIWNHGKVRAAFLANVASPVILSPSDLPNCFQSMPLTRPLTVSPNSSPALPHLKF